jgi:hypothetical protein
MGRLKSILQRTLLALWIIPTSFCSGAEYSHPDLVLVGSTPGDKVMKSILGIPASMNIDFIRWNLSLMDRDTTPAKFTLSIVYGISQPNTTGFMGGGKKRMIKGTYTVSKEGNEKIHGEIFKLKSYQIPKIISIVKLDENLFHLLTPTNELMVGNGGWSYSLNRKELIKHNSPLPALTNANTFLHDTARQVTFDGRTPCQSFANDHQWNVLSDCFKLKWRLILNRDTVTHDPTTYTARKVVDNAPKDVTGNWVFKKGVPGNPNVSIIELDPGKGKESISLLVGDQNVLFFLDSEYKLYTGNSDFSYTLNRK